MSMTIRKVIETGGGGGGFGPKKFFLWVSPLCTTVFGDISPCSNFFFFFPPYHHFSNGPSLKTIKQLHSRDLTFSKPIFYCNCHGQKMTSIGLIFQISTHIEKECPLSMISCPYDHMGCPAKVILI